MAAVEVSKRRRCGLTVAHVASLSESTTRSTLSECKALGLVSIDQRRQSPWINYPNKIQILSKQWASWLCLCTGAKSHSPNPPWRTEEGLSAWR